MVITYIHWGTEYTSCPNANQKSLAAQLAAAGASAVIGTHAHMLQGAGWRPDGTYVAYGLGNYLWWESFGNNQDDNGVLTLTFDDGKVVSDSFAPSHLDSTGVPVPADRGHPGPHQRRMDGRPRLFRPGRDRARRNFGMKILAIRIENSRSLVRCG